MEKIDFLFQLKKDKLVAPFEKQNQSPLLFNRSIANQP